MKLESCSNEFTKGMKWIEQKLIFNKDEINEKIALIDKQIETEKVHPSLIPNRKKRYEDYLELGIIDLDELEAYYLLYRMKSPLFDNYLEASKKPIFWNYMEVIHYESTENLFYLYEMGFSNNQFLLSSLDNLLKDQTIEGAFSLNEEDHAGLMRSLSRIIPDSTQYQNAISWWFNKWESMTKNTKINSIPFAALALMEINYEKYYEDIRKMLNYLKSVQNENGTWGETYLFGSDYANINSTITTYSIIALSKFYGINDLSAKKGIEFILKTQKENGSWYDRVDYTASFLLALLYMGYGQKIPLIYLENEIDKMKQKIQHKKSLFIHTSPLYLNKIHVKEIHSKIHDMLNKAKKEIRIASLYFDVFYEDIINIIAENPEMEIKIVTRPKRDIKGVRTRIANNVIDILERTTKGNLIQSQLIHARMLIIDDAELLVSSADFTRDQLYDEYNAGIWTTDSDAINSAIVFFDNIFEKEKSDNSSDSSHS